MNGHLEVARLLLQCGEDVNCADGRGDTALHDAAYFDHLEIAKLLIEHGADQHKTNSRGKTALDEARRCSRTSVAEYLQTII